MSACMKWCCCSVDQTFGSGWAAKAGGEGDGLGVSFGGGGGGGMFDASPTNAALPLAGPSTTS